MDPLSPWERAEMAISVLAVNPTGVKGLWLRARTSAVRDRITAVLTQLPLPLCRIHPSIDDTSLFGSVDLAATLASGHIARTSGILSSPAAIVLTMAERATPGLAARLARTLDDTGFCLIALDEGTDDEQLLPALSDRLGLFLDLEQVGWSDCAEIMLDTDRLALARAALPNIQMPPSALETLTTVAASLGISSLRAPLLAIATARALAAWNGRKTVNEDDLHRAVELILAHRGDAPQFTPEDADEAPPPPPDPLETEAETKRPDEMHDRTPDEILLQAARAALPADLLARLTAGRASGAAKGSGGSGAVRKGNHRGRPLPSRPGLPGSGKRIDLVATLRAAAPWQPLRRQGVNVGPKDILHLEIRQSDLRIKRYQESSDRVLIFAVDASGSSALARLAEAKGAIELLLAQAYARRDHVALIAFRGTTAELLLSPTRSLVQTKRRLAGLPGGGGTPLAAGLKMAYELAAQTRARGMTPTVALLTDGRGNIALDGTASREQSEIDTQKLARALRISGLPALIIDTANRPQPNLRVLANVLNAPYVALPRADAQRLSSVLQAALGD